MLNRFLADWFSIQAELVSAAALNVRLQLACASLDSKLLGCVMLVS